MFKTEQTFSKHLLNNELERLNKVQKLKIEDKGLTLKGGPRGLRALDRR